MSYENIQEALPEELHVLLSEGRQRLSRNGGMLELCGRTISLDYPRERFMLLSGRKANPFAQIAETAWVLAGRNDIDWLSQYLPRAEQFSDNGTTWRAGYGPRLRGQEPTRWTVDQVKAVIGVLKADINSRRAVISLWDPSSDYNSESKDIPCNNWIQFLCRDNALQMHVTARSNDVMWGWSGINAFEWSVLQEIVADSLGVDVGSANYYVGSFHLYDIHVERAQTIVNDNMGKRNPWSKSTITPVGLTYANLDKQLDIFFMRHNDIVDDYIYPPDWNTTRGRVILSEWLKGVTSPFLSNALILMAIYNEHKKRALTISEIQTSLKLLAEGDMKTVCIAWFEEDIARQERAALKAAKTTTTIFPPTSVTVPKATNRVGLGAKDIRRLLVELQERKGRTYGDSWKKHGEIASMFANISRKTDRIEVLMQQGAADTGSESLIDTVADLAVYTLLYASWLDNMSFPTAVKSLKNFAAFTATSEYEDAQEMLAKMLWHYGKLEAILLFNKSATAVDKQFHAMAIAHACVKYLTFVFADTPELGYKFAELVAAF